MDLNHFVVVVSGESLKAIFTSGLKEEMDRALMLLAKQSTSSKVVAGNSSAKVSESVSKPVSVVEIDVVKGTGAENIGSGIIGDVGLRERKCGRDRDGGTSRRIVLKRCDDVSRDGVDKTSAIPEATNLPPVLHPVEPVSSVRVEVSPHQRWTVGPNAPVQVFQVFYLPQDLTSYVDKSRAEVAERCLTRGGRVSSYLVTMYMCCYLIFLFLWGFNIFFV